MSPNEVSLIIEILLFFELDPPFKDKAGAKERARYYMPLTTLRQTSMHLRYAIRKAIHFLYKLLWPLNHQWSVKPLPWR